MGGAESKARARSYRHHNQLAERPGPPGKPLLVPSDKRSPEPDVVTIRWEPPLYDGGLPITGYLVEHRRTGSPHWVRSAPQLVLASELTLAGLEPGWRYQFRVSAQNAAGLSDPGELSDLLTVTLQRTAASAPFFVKELRDTVALENEKAELSVQVRGTPAPTLAWFKDGVEIFSSRSYRVVTDNEVSTLVIYQAALSDEGEVKCSATNRVGYAVTRAKLIIEAAPSIRLPRQYEEGLLFEKDEVIRLKVSVAGRPVPEVSWFLNGEPVPGGGRYEAGHSERYATLRVGEARREDRGEYQVRAVNRLGEDVASFLVTVADRPMPPGRAKVVMTLGRSITLSWSAPEDDGGCKIGNYIVEYFRVGWNMWLKAATCRQLTTTLGELIEGSEYKFRVKAENPYGVSDPSSESDIVFIPDPKRGLLEPPEHTGEEGMDIWMEDKKRPVSPSQAIEEQYGERKTKKKRGPMVPPQSPKPGIKDLLTPSDKHSILSEDSMSPPATPENPPVAPPKRRGKALERTIEKDILEEKEAAKRLEEKKKVEDFKKLEEKRQVEEAKRAEEQKKAEELKRNEEEKMKGIKIRSEMMTPQSPRMQRDRFHGSSELMLVLLPHSRAATEERDTTQSKKELFESSMALEGNDIAPPMSLSAPELGSGDPPEMPRVRAAFSSTELLHERAMARFYQDMEEEEAETNKRRGSVQRRRSFTSRTRDTLEKTASLQDIVSSMRSLNEQIEKKVDLLTQEPEEERPGKSTAISKSERISFMGDSLDSEISTDDRRRTLLAQTSEEDMEYEDSSFDEDEEDEYEEEEESVVDEQGEEEIEEELEEEEEEELGTYAKRGSFYTSESEDDRFSYSLEEDTYHPMSVNVKYNEDSMISAYEGRGPLILPSLPQTVEPSLLSKQSEPIPTSSTNTPGNEVKLKPILKKSSGENNTANNTQSEDKETEMIEEPKPTPLATPEKRFEPNFSPIMPKPILKVRDRSTERLSPSLQRKGTSVAEAEPELNLFSSRNNLDEGSDYESSNKKKQVRIEEPVDVAARISPDKIVETPATPIKTTQKEEEPRKRGASLDDEAEAARVLISHYSDIVAEVLLKEFGAIDYVDFSPLEPNYFAVTCSVRVQIYSALTKQPVKNLNKFRETAYGGSFRSDGLLLCAGGQESLVRLFDVESKSLLRVLRGHTSAVHRCFFTSDKTHVASFSDDKTVILWDVPSENKLHTFTGHDDYVRAGAVSPVSPTTVLSGCYDRQVRMFDARTSCDPVFTVDHGAPVESVLFLPSGGIFVSAGGTEVRVWDALAGGRLLARLCQHHKTVTCLCLASDSRRLLSGSLDRHVKIYDVSTYRPVHTIDYSSPVLSLAVSQKDTTVVAGTVDGLVSIRRREEGAAPALARHKKVGYRNVGDFMPSNTLAQDTILSASNKLIVPNQSKVKETKYDSHLRKFEYSKALDCVLAPYVVNKTPHVTVALFQELSRRRGLENALAGRDGKSLSLVLRFIVRYIGDYRFTRVLIVVSDTLLDIYGDNLSETGPEACQLFVRLSKKLREEEELTETMLSLQGAMEMLLAGSSAGDINSEEAKPEALKPSDTARQNFVISV